jgi:hypothetical protein
MPLLLALCAVLLALCLLYMWVVAAVVIGLSRPLWGKSERGRRLSAAYARISEWGRARMKGRPRMRGRRPSRRSQWLLGSFVLLALAYPSVFLVFASDTWGRLAARRGEVATGSEALGDLGTRIPVLAVDPVQVAGAVSVGQGDVPSVLQAANLRCTLYLGTANGFALLFDVRRQRLIRLPAGTAALEFGPGKARDLPRDCRP